MSSGNREPTQSRPIVTLGGRGSDPLVGVLIGERYRLLERIGAGGMGVVFRAEHIHVHKPVAIKLLHAQLGRIPEVVKRFEREVQSAERLHDQHIIEVIDSGRMANGALFLVMELLAGESLAQVIRRERRVPASRAIAVMRQVLAGLQHAHAQRVIHRDLKPENIILIEDDQVKLVDFGIAKIADDSLPALTQAGVVCGTPEYMAPEQATSPDIDGRVDVYACGVILYEMLTGEKPFRGRSAAEVMLLQMQRPPRAPRLVAPDANIPTELEATVLRAMAKSRDARFATAAEFLDALGGAPKVAPPVRSLRLRATFWWYRLRFRHPRLLLLWAVGIVALFLALVLFFAVRRRAAAVAKSATASSVDYLQMYAQAATCEERRDALLEMRKRGDRRALEPLRKLRSRKQFARIRACMSREEIDDAIRVLEGP